MQTAFRHRRSLQIGSNLEITALIQHFRKMRPPRSRILPGWDISLVLWSLAEPPFEPIEDPKRVPLTFLTWKLAFLLLFASGSRRGEIHAIKRSSVFIAENDLYMTMSLDPNFVSKTGRRARENHKPIRIPALKQLSSRHTPKVLAMCPVRCVKTYLKRTRHIFGKRRLLLISPQKNRKSDITKITMSSWVKRLILYCYNNPSERVARQMSIRTHDIRGIATTLLFKGTPAIEDIVTAGSWKSDNTFISHYLKDLTEINSEQLKRVGPIVAARKIIIHSKL